ncbi:DUF6270 domain-containing protein [Castellaniella sp.]|uniref:DUF6270 domain-containing protein n=1 Tax=Castellaniella sp. TaxID=1955812 RepID=UPI002AFF6DA3|nr:DUF6270 domain-containing protein [Castellaniella sp.]
MTRLFILGSCVSRDAIARADNGEFELVEYVARSSLSSVFAGSPFEDFFSHRLTSKFQSTLVKWDITKEARYRLAKRDYDVLLVDLIDERFDLAQAGLWACCTMSNEFIATGALSELETISVIKSGSEQFMQYWQAGWRSLVALLDSRSMRARILVNKVFWRYSTEGGQPFPNVTKARVEKANSTLSKMYEWMAEDLEPRQFITYEEEVMQCADEHEWGLSPFHYTERFYQATLSHLRSRIRG